MTQGFLEGQTGLRGTVAVSGRIMRLWWDICGLWRYREVAGRYVQVCGPYKSESKAGAGLLKGGTVRCGVVVSGAVEDFHGFE